MARQFLSDWVNARQTPEQRRLKYKVARAHNLNWSWSRCMRDWCWAKIALFLGYASLEDLFIVQGINTKDALSFKDNEEIIN
jgi:hypothetical protein